ncbi:MAG TPA: hypothetical protein VFZ77_08175 [Acidimicrobiales bacterium]
MTRHPFDPVSFVLGALTLAAGIAVLAGRSLVDEADLLLPAGLVGLGVALLVRVAGRREPLDPAATGGAMDIDPATDSGADGVADTDAEADVGRYGAADAAPGDPR